MTGARKIPKGHYLFREGDPPDNMYLIRSGQFAVVKAKTGEEVVLAEIGAGSMVGEMAFFDQQPRSAGVKALSDSEVILLPYKSLLAQFQHFPEWSKAIMKQVSKNLRSANQKIKQLESSHKEDGELSPLQLVQLLQVFVLCAQEQILGIPNAKTSDGPVVVNSKDLRRKTSQLFLLSSGRMHFMLMALEKMDFISIEAIESEGANQTDPIYNYTIGSSKLTFLRSFIDWRIQFLYKHESKQENVSASEVEILLLLVKHSPAPNHKGVVQFNLNEFAQKAESELGRKISFQIFDPLIEKNILTEKKRVGDDLMSSAVLEDLKSTTAHWDFLHRLQNLLTPPAAAAS